MPPSYPIENVDYKITPTKNFEMSLSAVKKSYEIVRPNHLPLIHRMLYQSFHVDEPMTKHLKLNQGPFSIKDTDAMVDALVFDHNLSIMVSDADTKSPLAVMLNGVFHRDEIDMSRQEVIASCEDPKFSAIAAMLHEVQVRSRDFFYKNNIETTFDLKIMATSPNARGMGLAKDLVNRSVQLAQCLGYKVCKTEATGDYSRKAFLRAGFEVVAECKYSEFCVENKKVFQGISDHQGVALMVKFLDQ